MRLKSGISLITLVAIFLFMTSSCSAELVYGVDISVHNKDGNTSVELNDLKVKPGEAEQPNPPDLTSRDFYVIQLLNDDFTEIYETSFHFNSSFSESRRYLFLPHSQDARYLYVIYGGYEDLRISVDLQEGSCNKNGICDIYETYYSCPEDCEKCSEDGICDEECSRDPDCYDYEADGIEVLDFTGYIIWFALLVIIIIVITLLLLRRKRQTI